jgi:hypothetical protein
MSADHGTRTVTAEFALTDDPAFRGEQLSTGTARASNSNLSLNGADPKCEPH